MQDIIGYVILFLVFCAAPMFAITLIAGTIWWIRRSTKNTQTLPSPIGNTSSTTNMKQQNSKPIARTAATQSPRAGLTAASASKNTSLTRATPAPPQGGWTPLYLNFSNKPRAILENMSALVAQADKVNATKTRWSKGPRILFWLGLGLMLIEGLIYLLGYTP
jgi:hypothetical protein